MVKITCDRCGKEVKGTTYYTIDIRGRDINSACHDYTSDLCSSSTAAFNLQYAFEAIYGQRHYCEDCKNEIRDFIASKEVK